MSEWGHDFRPEYRRLGDLRGDLQVPLVALTATAPPHVRRDIERSLKLRTGFHVAAKTADRPNLTLSCQALASGFGTVLRDVAKSLGKGNGSTFIYCSTRNEVEATAALKTARSTRHDHSCIPRRPRRRAPRKGTLRLPRG